MSDGVVGSRCSNNSGDQRCALGLGFDSYTPRPTTIANNNSADKPVIMWRCIVTGENVSDYLACSKVFDNIVNFIVDNDKSEKTYLDLIDKNRELFLKELEHDDRQHCVEIVEPRELLFLLHNVDSADRLQWAPRPYRRTGDITKEFVFHIPETNTLTCLFCGYFRPGVAESPSDGVTRSTVFESPGTSQHQQQQQQQQQQPPAESQQRHNGHSISGSFAAYGDAMIAMAREEMDNTIQRHHGGAIPENYGAVNGNLDAVNSQRQRRSLRNTRSFVRRAISFETTFHFKKCPLVWLEKNCNWTTKNCSCATHDPSKFTAALKILQRSRNRSMLTETEWNEFVKLTSITTAMGACEDTILKCYRALVRMKLDHVERSDFDLCPLYAVYYEKEGATYTAMRPRWNRPLACVLEHTSQYTPPFRLNDRTPNAVPPNDEMRPTAIAEADLVKKINNDVTVAHRNETDLAQQYLEHLFSKNVTVENIEPSVYAIPTEMAKRALVMHGFCVLEQKNEPNSINFYDMTAERTFTDSGVNGCVMRHIFKAPSFDVMCIYCGNLFTSRLCDPALVATVYTDDEKVAIEDYLLATQSGTNNFKPFELGFGKSGPHQNWAVCPMDVLATRKVKTDIRQESKNTPSGQRKLALWLSASLNICHTSNCIFRVNRRNWMVDTCLICMTENIVGDAPFNCGHAICNNCLNEIRITHCPMCRIGTRKSRVIKNYCQ